MAWFKACLWQFFCSSLVIRYRQSFGVYFRMDKILYSVAIPE